MASKKYPSIPESSLNKDEMLNVLVDFCRDISRTRTQDINEFSQITNSFIKGRKVGKIPTSSSDTTNNRIGDFNYDANYIYICVDDSGFAAWRRVSIGSF